MGSFPALVLKELLVLFIAKISLMVDSFSAVSGWLRRLATINSFSLENFMYIIAFWNGVGFKTWYSGTVCC